MTLQKQNKKTSQYIIQWEYIEHVVLLKGKNYNFFFCMCVCGPEKIY